MKSITLNIHPELNDVTVTVRNGKAFTDALISGEYKTFIITAEGEDLERIKRFAVKHGNDKSSCHGTWYAHCNGYAMDLCVTQAGNYITLNTYRPYGRASK